MTKFLSKAVIAAATCGVALGAYPSTFPFENEGYVPADVKASTPDFSFDAASDPGGYIYRGNYMMEVFDGTLTDADIPYCHHSNQYSMFLMITVYGTPPVLPVGTWNCTPNELLFTEADFTGMVNNEKICNVGECCTGLLGLPKFGADQMTWHSWADDRAASGLCEAPQTEELYCVMVGGHFQANCYDYYPSPTDRIYMQVCYDNFVHYWLNCAVFKQAYAYTYTAGSQDTPTYQDSLTLDESMSFDAVFYQADRICNPYSYFFPDTAASSSATSGASTASEASASEASASASASDASSAGMKAFVASMLVAALA